MTRVLGWHYVYENSLVRNHEGLRDLPFSFPFFQVLDFFSFRSILTLLPSSNVIVGSIGSATDKRQQPWQTTERMRVGSTKNCPKG